MSEVTQVTDSLSALVPFLVSFLWLLLRNHHEFGSLKQEKFIFLKS